jgi:transposase-like protein
MSRTPLPSSGRRRAAAARREQLLVAFERSGLSAAEFARQHGLSYTTFCGWRKRWERAKGLPAFVQVEVAPSTAPEELVIEFGAGARMRVHSEGQMALAARLLERLNPGGPC